MIKLIGSLLIIVSTTMIGILYGNTLKDRVSQLKELNRCMYLLKNEIFYTYTSLPEALNNVGKKSKGVIKQLFTNTSQLLTLNKVDSVYDAWIEVINKYKDNISLEEEDIDIILNFTKTLGNSDVESQQGLFCLIIKNLENQIRQAEEKMNNNVKVFRYIGFSIGFIIVIILL